MASLKQAVIAREHLGPDLDMALFYMDMRTPRKDFEKYMVRIKDQGARLIRSRVHTRQARGRQRRPGDPLRHRDRRGPGRNLRPVVLSVGMVIPPDTVELAERLDVHAEPQQLRGGRLLRARCPPSGRASYACGAFNGPKDIPQSVMEGSAAAAAATRDLAAARGTLLKEKDLPAGKGPDRRAGPGGRLCLQLRPQHRRRGRCAGHRGIRQGHPQRGLRPGQPLHLLPGRPGPDGGDDQGARPEPGGGGGLQPLHPRSPSSRTCCAPPASTSISSRWPTSATSAPGSTSTSRSAPRKSARTW